MLEEILNSPVTTSTGMFTAEMVIPTIPPKYITYIPAAEGTIALDNDGMTYVDVLLDELTELLLAVLITASTG